MTENLQEFVDSHGVAVRVDRDRGVLSGVKLIGLQSRNGRHYRESALEQAKALYEEAKVNVNHSKEGPLTPRDYQDRLGVIRSVKFRKGEGLFGNLHFNPKHPLAEQLTWDAEHNPRNVGFSHNVLARLSREENKVVVEQITQVQSVDLVADPAATRGLFEQADDQRVSTGNERPRWDALTLETLRVHRPDLLEQCCTSATQKLQSQLEESRSQLIAARQRYRVIELLNEHRLVVASGNETNQTEDHTANPIVSRAFFEMLMKIENDKELQQLIAERSELVGSMTSKQTRLADLVPKSRDQLIVQTARFSETTGAEEFAAAIQSLA